MQDVGVSGIVEVDLVSDEGLFCSMSGGCSPKQHRMAYLVNGDTSTHRGQDASDVVRAKGLGVECTREIPNPQMGHDLVHRHSVVSVWWAITGPEYTVRRWGGMKSSSWSWGSGTKGSQATKTTGACNCLAQTSIVRVTVLLRRLPQFHLVQHSLRSSLIVSKGLHDHHAHERSTTSTTNRAGWRPKGTSVCTCHLFRTDIADDVLNNGSNRPVIPHVSQPHLFEEHTDSPNFSTNEPQCFGRSMRNRYALLPLSATRCWPFHWGRCPEDSRR